MKKLPIILLALALVFGTLFLASCGGSRLEVPQRVRIDDSYTMTWESVENSRGYTVGITAADGTYTEETARRASYSLARLAEGDYLIQLKAVGGGGFSDSEWTGEYEFHKDYENGCLYELIDGGISYRLIGAGTSGGRVEVGDLYRGKPVTEIGEAAFRSSSYTEQVIVGSNVTTIGANAFYNCSRLTSITLPQSLTAIGEAAFQACPLLDNVVIPSGVTELSANLFNYCRGLTSVTLPETLTAIGNYAFANCTSLTAFEFPDSVVTVGNYAFLEDVFTEIVIGRGVESLGTGAFANNDELLRVVLGDSLHTVGESAFSRCTALTEIVFSDEGVLTTLGVNAFAYCTALTEVTLPEGLQTISAYAFVGNTGLRSAVIPDSVTSVGQFSFLRTGYYLDAKERDETYVYVGDWLVEIVEGKETSIHTVGDDSISEGYRPEGFVPLRSGLRGIGDAVFMWTSVQRVILPDSVRHVGAMAFYQCEQLWAFQTTANSSLVSLGLGAFYECEGLYQLYLYGSALTDIGSYAFYGCTRLDNSSNASIIPDSVEHIGMMAFYGTALFNAPDEYGVIYAGNWVVGFEWYMNSMNYMGLLAQGSSDAWMYEDILSDVTYVRLSADVRGIADFAFYGHRNLVQVDGMVNARYIGEGAFYGCIRLGSASLNRNLRTIEDYTFYGCEALQSVNIPSQVTSIGRSAFYDCRRLTDIEFTINRLEVIQPFAFYNCVNLQAMDFGSVGEIGRYAFYNCRSLTEVSLPAGLTEIGDSAFYGCSGLRTLSMGEGPERILPNTFAACTSLREIALPESVTEVGDYAFYGCSAVTAVAFGGTERIGSYAFAMLTSLRSLVLPDSVTSVDSYAFRGCTGLISVLLQGNGQELGIHAFYGCTDATVFSDADGFGSRWNAYWNSSYRPVVWGVTLSEDGSFVHAVTLGGDTFSYVNQGNPVGSPGRSGFTFAGWAAQEGGEPVYEAADLASLPAGTTVYAVWTEGEPAPPEEETEPVEPEPEPEPAPEDSSAGFEIIW